MNPLEILEKFGLPVAVSMAFGFFIWKQNKYIQDDLSKDLANRFARLEGIIIKLIDNAKKNELQQRSILSSYKALVDIITKLLNKEKK